MAGTSVLSLASEQDRHHQHPRFDAPLHPKLKAVPPVAALPPSPPTETTVGGLHIISERDEDAEHQDSDAVRQQYENMTVDDLSHCMSENYKQLSAILGPSGMKDLPSAGPAAAVDHDDSPIMAGNDDNDDNDMLIDRTDLDDAAKRRKMTRLFCRAASTGDVHKLTQWLDGPHRAYIDIDARDEDGTTPLIYAACFGKADIAQALLDAGAKTDVQDAYGWSALMWATNNNQDAIVKMLLENGASSRTRSAKGRTVFDFLNTDNQKIIDILATNPRDSMSSTTSSVLGARKQGSMSSTTSSNADDCDFYFQSTPEAYDSFMVEEADRRRKLLETAMALADGHSLSSDIDDDDDDRGDQDADADDADADDYLHNEFQWDRCLPDQMFVFGADSLQDILDTVITNIQLPVQSRQEICVPASVIFLSARFAHYFSSDDLLQDVMTGAMERISKEIKANARNIHILSFWVTNATQLLYYLKKDTGLVTATAEHQLRISELISEIYGMIVSDTERRLIKLLPRAMLQYEQIPGMEDVNFADDWQRFFRRSSRRSVMVPPDGGLAVQMKRSASTGTAKDSSITNTSEDNSSSESPTTNTTIISPQSVTSLLTSTLYVLQSYDVHPTIIIQALAQFFHYMSCELFNRILTNKKLLCRSKALQIRMNISHIEDWITHEHLPSSLASYLEPTTQLLQLLQCLTQLPDLVTFIHTAKKFEAINALQMKRCVTNYRYEVNEPRLPEEIEKYALQIAEDTLRYKQARSLEIVRRRRSLSMSRSNSLSMQRSRSRRNSVSSFVGSLISSVGLTTSTSLPPSVPSSPIEQEQADQDVDQRSSPVVTDEPDEKDEEDKEIEETRDTKFMLPFSVPTTAHMVSINGWAPDSSSKGEDRLVTPIIPDDWMEKLDSATAIITPPTTTTTTTAAAAAATDDDSE